ncbi:MerR family transcriptional regulator [Pulveribacter sp.]|uniref:MerR family transcriptional regulator n=1 Tax=Pulveribacter sp. TaxID=2678893 RepID=UPI000EF12AF4|nr:MerR family transcriptional regulator [Pulveribacter sp.]HCL86080.1 MerR family transcriptional regulator [Comamonadaceae bacterium]
MSTALPSIPAKRYFTIGEVAQLCGVKPHVLRYWEQEFSQLRPMKRRGNRRYYQHHEVLMIRRIRELLYEQGFTISGARNRLTELAQAARMPAVIDEDAGRGEDAVGATVVPPIVPLELADQEALKLAAGVDPALLRRELEEIRAILF